MLPMSGLSYVVAGLACLRTLPGTLAQPGSRFSQGCPPLTGSSNLTAQHVIGQLGMAASEEKGYYVETFRDPVTDANNRSVSTAIYYLLEGATGRSSWHRLDAAEVWHYYGGAPLSLFLSFDDGQPIAEKVLGPDFTNGQSPQIVIQTHEWQQALSHGDWTLVGTTGKYLFFLWSGTYLQYS